ncbi:MAG: holo-ACP synthase [bacterium]|nr:holo-ACP synthase [bacterium]
MIIGIGSDIVEISRVRQALKRQGDRFLMRLFTPVEQKRIAMNLNPAATCAKRFAAKEAFAKALGTGKAQGISWKDIQVSNDDLGCPSLDITGVALEILNTKIPEGTKPYFHVTLADTQDHAQAFVVIEARPE